MIGVQTTHGSGLSRPAVQSQGDSGSGADSHGFPIHKFTLSIATPSDSLMTKQVIPSRRRRHPRETHNYANRSVLGMCMPSINSCCISEPGSFVHARRNALVSTAARQNPHIPIIAPVYLQSKSVIGDAGENEAMVVTRRGAEPV